MNIPMIKNQLQNYQVISLIFFPKISTKDELVKDEEPNPFRSSFASDPAEELRKCEINFEPNTHNNFDHTKNTIDLPSDYSRTYTNCPIDLVEIINKDSLFLSKYSEKEQKNDKSKNFPLTAELPQKKNSEAKFNLKDQIVFQI